MWGARGESSPNWLRWRLRRGPLLEMREKWGTRRRHSRSSKRTRCGGHRAKAMVRSELRARPCAKNAQGWGTRGVEYASEVKSLGHPPAQRITGDLLFLTTADGCHCPPTSAGVNVGQFFTMTKLKADTKHPLGGQPYTTTTEDSPALWYSKSRDARVVEIFQRFLTLKPFEHEESVDPECPQ